MSDPYVRPIGETSDFTGVPVILGVDYDTVTIHYGRWESGGGIRLTGDAVEEFARSFVSAVWKAGQQKRELAEEGR